jgi:hypothetical protein
LTGMAEQGRLPPMPNIQLVFSLDDLTLAWIDKIRGEHMDREAFFRRMIQYGLANTFEELARLTRDYATQDTSNKTAIFHKGRELFTIEAARNLEKPALEHTG